MQTVVGVLRGGPSREHEVSLKSGAAILSNLSPERYHARDIYIDKQGTWHEQGRPIAPERILRQIDVALIGLHGEYGEDGGVQKLLERFGVPYTGADSFSSYLAMHKIMSKARAKDFGLLTPEYKYIEKKDLDFIFVVNNKKEAMDIIKLTYHEYLKSGERGNVCINLKKYRERWKV